MKPSESSNTKTPNHDDMHLWLYNEANQYIVAMRCLKVLYPSWLPAIKLDKTPFGLDEKNKRIYRYVRAYYRMNIDSVEREMPVYTGYGNKYLQGICDAIIKFEIKIIKEGETLKAVPRSKHDKDFPKYLIGDGYEHKWKCDSCSEKENNKFTTAEGKTVMLHGHTVKHYQTYDIGEFIETFKERKYFEDILILVEFKPELKSVSGIIGQIKSYRDSINGMTKFDHNYRNNMQMVIVTYDTNTKYDKIIEAEGIRLIRIERDWENITDGPAAEERKKMMKLLGKEEMSGQ